MYPTSIISITFTDLIEQPDLFKSILSNLIKICEIEIQKGEIEKELEKERKLQRKPRAPKLQKKPRTKKKEELKEAEEEEIKEEIKEGERAP